MRTATVTALMIAWVVSLMLVISAGANGSMFSLSASEMVVASLGIIVFVWSTITMVVEGERL